MKGRKGIYTRDDFPRGREPPATSKTWKSGSGRLRAPAPERCGGLPGWRGQRGQGGIRAPHHQDQTPRSRLLHHGGCQRRTADREGRARPPVRSPATSSAAEKSRRALPRVEHSSIRADPRAVGPRGSRHQIRAQEPFPYHGLVDRSTRPALGGPCAFGWRSRPQLGRLWAKCRPLSIRSTSPRPWKRRRHTRRRSPGRRHLRDLDPPPRGRPDRAQSVQHVCRPGAGRRTGRPAISNRLSAVDAPFARAHVGVGAETEDRASVWYPVSFSPTTNPSRDCARNARTSPPPRASPC